MKKFEELVQKYCPDGVEWKSLYELGDFYSGLSGKTKDDFKDGNAKFITYVNIFNNPSLKTDIEEKVKISPGEKQNTVQYGDVLFTGSSETPDECGMCSVLTHHTDEQLYLNSFCFGFRLFDLSDKSPDYLKHLFRSTSIRKAICKTANGVTRFNVSKKEFAKIEIPLPPLPVQEEIARILDKFAELQAELQTELQKRLLQYYYYRDNLLSFEGRVDVEWKKLGDVMTIQRGASPRPIQNFLTNDENGVPWIKIGDVSPLSKYITSTKERVTKEGAAKSRFLKKGSFILSNSMSFGRPYILEIDGCIHDGWISMCDFQEHLNPDFLYHVLRSNTVQNYWVSKANSGGAVANLNSDIVRETLIPIPTFQEQQKVVDILDRFNVLTSDLSQGLPAEIEKRRQQYEFYRDKLLTFKRKEA